MNVSLLKMKEEDSCFNHFQKKYLKENNSDLERRDSDKDNRFSYNNQLIIKKNKEFTYVKGERETQEVFILKNIIILLILVHSDWDRLSMIKITQVRENQNLK